MIALFVVALVLFVIFGAGFLAPILAMVKVHNENKGKRQLHADRVRGDQRFNQDQKRFKANSTHIVTLDHNWNRE